MLYLAYPQARYWIAPLLTGLWAQPPSSQEKEPKNVYLKFVLPRGEDQDEETTRN